MRFDILLRMEKKRTTPRLCNRDCNNCEAIENPQVALLLNFLVLRFGDEVVQIVNKFCPNLTCCPDCSADDFCHNAEGRLSFLRDKADGRREMEFDCDIAETAWKEFMRYATSNGLFLKMVEDRIMSLYPGKHLIRSMMSDCENTYFLRLYDIPDNEVDEAVDAMKAVVEYTARHFPRATFEIQPSVVSHTQCVANFPEMLDTKDKEQ